jgi:outer membrane cobalamin receptor
VVQIFTKKGEGKAKPYVGLGQSWHEGSGGVSGGAGGWDYSLGVSHASSNGFNAKTSAGFNPDADGYRSNAFNGRVATRSTAINVEATALTSYMNAGYDATVSKTSPMADDRSIYKMNAVGLNWLAKWSDVYSTRLQYTQSRDFYQTKPSVYETDTRLHSYLFQNEWRLGAQTVTAALDAVRTSWSTTAWISAAAIAPRTHWHWAMACMLASTRCSSTPAMTATASSAATPRAVLRMAMSSCPTGAQPHRPALPAHLRSISASANMAMPACRPKKAAMWNWA